MVGQDATIDEHRRKRWHEGCRRAFGVALYLGLVLMSVSALGQSPEPSASSAPVADTKLFQASGDVIHRWQLGDAEATYLVGNVILLHGTDQMQASEAMFLVDGPPGDIRVRVAAIPLQRESTEPWMATLKLTQVPFFQAPQYRGAPAQLPTLLYRLASEDQAPTSDVEQVQYQSLMLQPPDNRAIGPPSFPEPPMTLSGGSTTGGMQFFVGGGTRSVEVLARGSTMPPEISTINRPEAGETVVIARGGVTVLVRDVTAQLPTGELLQLGTISLSADRIVGWLPLMTQLFDGTSQFSQSEGELYLEGDIVFRQGDRVIYADAMYFNVTKEIGMVLEAEAITSVPGYQGVARLKADVLQQVSRGNFIAFDAAITSSRMGVPRYWLQSQQLQLNDRERTVIDPATGAPIAVSSPYVTSTNNFVYFGGVPLLYWPTFATPLEVPTFYISGAKVTRDSVFGTQFMVDFNLLQILGLENVPDGVTWTLSTDYLSERGPALGTNLNYNLPGLLGVAGPVQGMFDAWFIDDSGLDTLGRDRQNLQPEEDIRGRALLRHRHYLPNDYEFIAELGYLSDRNFLEQYFENEWDQDVDHRTGIRFKKYFYNNQFELSAYAQANDFFQVTEELPRFDHHLLGGSIGDLLTYSVHNHVGYSKLNVAEAPTNPIELANFQTLPGEVAAEGLIASTRQELAMPVQAGVVKLVPFVSGEAVHYGEAADNDSLVRLLGQAGVRASLPMWRFDPSVQSSLLNVRGLAHKLEWTGEYFYADSNTNFEELPLYDPLDDNAQEQFRRRFIFDTYGGTLPDRFDPRTYALRHGIQSWVTSPSETIADDLQIARLGINNRWQTKRGLPGRERIVDLLRVDAELTLYPNADRDNFGETIGPATYDMRYNLGDRVTLLSDGYVDFFDQGLRSFSAGIHSSRPGQSDIYVGLLSLEGPISSTVLRSAVDVRLNEKWILSTGSTYDFGSAGNVGQTFGLTRIGESFLVQFGLNIDPGRDNVSAGFMIEPRFWPTGNLGRLGGQLIPPPGVEGLE